MVLLNLDGYIAQRKKIQERKALELHLNLDPRLQLFFGTTRSRF
uniref:Uncharacterized protein n=1 Tax=Alteromonadaceae bacterium PE-TB08W TaxID=1199097 RepID=A0A3G9E4T5_9ALTE|nr:hypothetical protein (truncated) [Alteromonadaceae bacterium PE-TB08W]